MLLRYAHFDKCSSPWQAKWDDKIFLDEQISASPIEQKRLLVKTLFDRARRICTEDTLHDAETRLTERLLRNSYPQSFITFHSRKNTMTPPTQSVQKKPVYITLPFKGDRINAVIRKRLKATINRTYPTAELRMLNKPSKIGPSNTKARLSIFAKSNCIYLFECTCGCKYIGRSNRQFGCRAKVDQQEARQTSKRDHTTPFDQWSHNQSE